MSDCFVRNNTLKEEMFFCSLLLLNFLIFFFSNLENKSLKERWTTFKIYIKGGQLIRNELLAKTERLAGRF